MSSKIRPQLSGDAAPITAYGTMLAHIHADSEVRRLAHYRAETRWPGSLYWKRRQLDRTLSLQLNLPMILKKLRKKSSKPVDLADLRSTR